MYTIKKLYGLEHTLVSDCLLRFEYLWQILSGIKKNIASLSKSFRDFCEEIKEYVYLHKIINILSVYISSSCDQYIMSGNSIFKNSGIVVQKD